MPPANPRSYHHRHLDFAFLPQPDGTARLDVHSAEVLRSLLDPASGGGAGASGYIRLGSVTLSAPMAAALESGFCDLGGALPADQDRAAAASRARRLEQATRLEAFFVANKGNPLVENGVVVDPRSSRGTRLVQAIRDGQAEPQLLRDWLRLRMEWRAIMALA